MGGAGGVLKSRHGGLQWGAWLSMLGLVSVEAGC